MKKLLAMGLAFCFSVSGLTACAKEIEKSPSSYEGIYTAYSFVTEDGVRYGLGSTIGNTVLQENHFGIALKEMEEPQYDEDGNVIYDDDFGSAIWEQNIMIIAWSGELFSGGGYSFYTWEKNDAASGIIATDGTNEQWIKCDGETLIMRFEKAEWTFKKSMDWSDFEEEQENSSSDFDGGEDGEEN